jgi:hypothetical protein
MSTRVVEEGICLCITINVPLVYMTRDMILMREINYKGHWKGCALIIETFLAKKSQLELLSGFLPYFSDLQNAIQE